MEAELTQPVVVAPKQPKEKKPKKEKVDKPQKEAAPQMVYQARKKTEVDVQQPAATTEAPKAAPQAAPKTEEKKSARPAKATVQASSGEADSMLAQALADLKSMRTELNHAN